VNHFDQAVAVVLRHEGSTYTDSPTDHGGPTKYGLTLHDLKLAGLASDKPTLQALTEAQARGIYSVVFWDPEHYGDLNSVELATCVFDQRVLGGPTAVADLQNLLGCRPDGVLGLLTASAANRADGADLALRFLRSRAQYYIKIAKNSPDQLEWVGGWVDRLWDLAYTLFLGSKLP
jgi:lysozyme family protein